MRLFVERDYAWDQLDVSKLLTSLSARARASIACHLQILKYQQNKREKHNDDPST